MNKEVVCLVTKQGDKNHSIQLWSDDINKVQALNDIFCDITFIRQCISPLLSPTFINLIQYKPFIDLQLFRQGYAIEGEKDFCIILETWSDKEDLMIEFGEFCAKELELPFDII